MIKQPFFSARHKQRGFTLIEVLIAALVLSVGLLGLASLQGVALKMNQGSYLRVQAVSLAYEIADAMRANRINAVGYLGTFGTVTCNMALPYTWSGAMASADLTIWRNRLACLLPNGNAVIAQAGNLYTITVVWDDSRFSGSTTQSFAFTTEL